MTKTLQNLFFLLAIVVVGGLGWYIYMQNSQRTLLPGGSSTVEANVQMFRQQQVTLRALQLDLQILSRQEFRSLNSVSEPVPQLPRGRTTPFLPF